MMRRNFEFRISLIEFRARDRLTIMQQVKTAAFDAITLLFFNVEFNEESEELSYILLRALITNSRT